MKISYRFYRRIKNLWAFGICLFFTLSLAAQHNVTLESSIQLKRTSGTIIEFLTDLQQVYTLSFSYDESIIPDQKFSTHKSSWQLKDFLQKLLQKAHLKFEYINGQIIIKKYNQSKVTLNGTVTGQADGELLIGATVYIKELGTGTTTNAYGFYSLSVPPGEYTLMFSYIGYKRKLQVLKLEQSQTLDMPLISAISHLNEVVVKAKQEEEIESIEAIQMSAHHIEIAQVKTTPMFAGEADILKSIQFLPGIQNANAGTSNFSVRGGSYDQNLILLDEAPVYNVSHAMGLFSVFNVDAVKNITVYKGAIPARFGGRLSSVVDIRMKEGNSKKFSLQGSVGLIGSRLMVESPIGQKVSFMLAGRYGYPGFTANKLAGQVSKIAPGVRHFGSDNDINFYDLNAKLNVKIDRRNKLYLSAFRGKDHFFNNTIFEDNTLDWGNQTGTLRWNHIFNPKLFGNLTLIYGNFDYAYQINNDLRNFRWDAQLQQQGLKLDFDYFSSPKHTLRFGVSLAHRRFRPGQITPLGDSSAIQAFALDPKQAIESGIYLTHETHIGQKILLNYGLRFSAFHNLGAGTQYIYDDQQTLQETKVFGKGEVMNSYYGLEPRVSVRYLLNDQTSVKASYNRTYQYLHLVSNSSVGLPTDVWLPVDNNIKPRYADQVALGIFKDFKNATYRASVEVYHKWIAQVIDYKDNADIFLNKNIETQIRVGNGKAYGAEFLLEKRKGKLTGWLSYTLSKVIRNIQGVNQNKAYSPGYDRRHNASMVLTYRLSKRWEVSANYSYMTGVGITVPQGVYISNERLFNYYTERNAFKLPAFHQLDLSIKLKSNRKKRWQGEWIFGVTNAYNQKNPLTYFINPDKTLSNQEKVYQLYLFGLMPSVNYNFKF